LFAIADSSVPNDEESTKAGQVHIPELAIVVLPAINNNEYIAIRLREADFSEQVGLLTKLRQLSKEIRFAGYECAWTDLDALSLNRNGVFWCAVWYDQNIDISGRLSRKSCAWHSSEALRDVRKPNDVHDSPLPPSWVRH
jgi:hypothetical protein